MDYFNQLGASKIIRKKCRICKQNVRNHREPRGIRRENILKLISNEMTVEEFKKPCVICLECMRRLILKHVFSKFTVSLKEEQSINKSASTMKRERAAWDLLNSLMNNSHELYNKLDRFITGEKFRIVSEQRVTEEQNLLDFPSTVNNPTFGNVPQSTPLNLVVDDACIIEVEPEVQQESTNLNNDNTESNTGGEQFTIVPEQLETEEPDCFDFPTTVNYSAVENVLQSMPVNLMANDGDELTVITGAEFLILPDHRETEERNLLDLPSTSNYTVFEHIPQSTDMVMQMDLFVDDEFIDEGEPEVRPESTNLNNDNTESNTETLGETAEEASRAVVPLRKPRRPRSTKSINILCNVCNKVFKYKGALKKHEAAH